jgi:hypothetical protein
LDGHARLLSVLSLHCSSAIALAAVVAHDPQIAARPTTKTGSVAPQNAHGGESPRLAATRGDDPCRPFEGVAGTAATP